MTEDLTQVKGTDLTCLRGGRLVLKGLNFEARSGVPLIVRGPNGAGKSTLLRLIAGLVSFQAGQLKFNGANSKPLDEETVQGRLLHYVGHLDAVKPGFTVEENLQFWRALYGEGASLDEALNQLEISFLKTVPGQFLSAGQKRRVGLARLLVSHRPLWILDEPTSSLDTDGAALVRGMIEGHLSRGGLVIATTHVDLGLEGADVLHVERQVQGEPA